MANNKKIVQQLTVLLESLGYEKVNREVKSVQKGMKGVEQQSRATATAQNRVKRAQEGVHKTSLAQGKEFSRQAQGLGGLVRAYATVAANVFALSSAFLVLKRAADFDSMMISANSMTKNMGVNVANLSRDLQMATGANLSFAQSLEITNKALAAGFSASQFSELGDIVTKVSQTFGGSIEANMNRVTQAILRGRTETLATMGIVIDLEQAYTSYALTIGKTRQELTKFEEQQATLNAFLAEGRKQVGEIQKDPNPYDKMLRSLQDVSQEIMTGLSKRLFNPLIALLNESRGVALGLIAVLAAVFAKNLTPDMASYAASAKKSLDAANTAMNRVQTARQQHLITMQMQVRKHESKVRAQARKSVIETMKNEEKKRAATIKNQDAIAKYVRTLSRATTNDLKRQTTEMVAALKNAEAALTRRINRLKKQGVADTDPRMAQLLAERQSISIVRGEGTVRNKEAMTAASKSVATLSSRLKVATTSVKAFTASLVQQAAITRMNTLALIQENGIIRGTIASYRAAVIPIRSVISAKTALITITRLLSTTMAVAGAAINKVIPALALLYMGWEIVKVIMEKLAGPTKKAMKDFEDAFEAIQEESTESAKRLKDIGKVIETFQNDKTFHNLAKQVAFIANATSEASMGVEKLRQAVDGLATVKIKIGEDESIFVDITQRKAEAEAELIQLKQEKEAAYLAWLREANKSWISWFKDEWSDAIDEKKEEIDELAARIEAATNVLPKVFAEARKRVDRSINLREAGGLDTSVVQEEISKAFSRGIETAASEAEASALRRASEALEAGKSLQEITDLLKGMDSADGTRALNLLSVALDIVAQKTQSTSNAIKTFGETALDIKKKLQEGENAYLDKVGFTEEANLIKQLLNNLRTIKITGGAVSKEFERLLTQTEEGKVIRDYFGIEPTIDNIEMLKSALTKLLSDYNTNAKNLVIIEQQIKLNKITQESLKLNEKFGLTREGWITNTRRMAEEEQRSYDLQRRQINNEIERINLQLTNQKLNAETRHILELQRGELAQQRDLYEKQRDLINPILEAKLKELEIEGKILDKQKDSISGRIEILKLQRAMTSSAIDLFNIDKMIISQQAAQKINQIKDLQNRANEIQARVDAGRPVGLEGSLELQEIITQQKVLRQELINMSRDSARLSIEMAARAGDFEKSQQMFGISFLQEYDTFVKKLESAGKRAGDAFVTAMDSGIDLLIDNLLSGESNFMEAIKGIAREGIGGILKDNMKLAGRTILNEVFKNQDVKPDQEDPLLTNANLQLTELSEQTSLLRQISGKELIETPANNGVLERNTNLENQVSKLGIKVPSIDMGTVTSPEATERGLNVLAQAQLDQLMLQSGYLATLAGIPPPAAAEDVKAMGEDVKVATSESTNTAVSGMGSILSSLLGNIGGDGVGGSFARTFGSALFSQIPGFMNGGVIKGGINSYANGTITSGPELALIGEGRRNEAIVPLPNNREIPVQLSGDSGSNVEINQVFDFRNADPSSERRLRTEAEKIKQESFNAVFSEINKGGRYAKAVGRRK